MVFEGAEGDIAIGVAEVGVRLTAGGEGGGADQLGDVADVDGAGAVGIVSGVLHQGVADVPHHH